MVIVGLVLILMAQYELDTHQETLVVNYDGPSRSGYDVTIINLPYWVYPIRYTGLTIGTVGLLLFFTLLDPKRYNQ